MASFGCVDEVDSFLPRPLVEDILRKYADVLRVGHVEVNGSTVKWDTNDASNPAQLHGFCTAILEAIRSLEEAKGLQDNVLHEAVYCVCKAVSINYVLSDVLQLVSRRVGEPCSIETRRKDGSSLVSYNVELSELHRIRVRMSWTGNGNIFSCNRTNAKKRIRGTLSFVETEFPLPIGSDFVPTYHLQLNLKRSPAQRLITALACNVAAPADRGASATLLGQASRRRGFRLSRQGRTETMFLDMPLRYSGSQRTLPIQSVGSGKSNVTCSTRSTMSHLSHAGTVQSPNASDDDEEGNDSEDSDANLGAI